MSRRRRMANLVAGELNLTAMIDVAFQLLAFFIITVHPVDIFTNFDANRPSPLPPGPAEPPSIRIDIYDNAYTINETPMDFKKIEEVMAKLASFDAKRTVLIMCRKESMHAQLVGTLDLCAKLGMKNLAVVSAN